MQVQLLDTSQSQLLDYQAQAAQARLSEIREGGSIDKAKIRETAEAFEAVFLSQMLKPMFETVETDSFFGGGRAEEIYRSQMVEEVGKSMAKNGGIGIADTVYKELLKLQEG